MNSQSDNKMFSAEWEADSRYFETKPGSYFRAMVVLAVLSSILLFFLKESLLVFMVWILFFVAYVRSTVSPPKIKYSLGKFGLRYYNYYLNYPSMAVFGIVKKKQGRLLRIFTHPPQIQEFNILLPEDETRAEEIIEALKERVPYVEQIPKSGVEKIADFLGKATGLN